MHTLLERVLKTHMDGGKGLVQSVQSMIEQFESVMKKAIETTTLPLAVGVPGLTLTVPTDMQLDESIGGEFRILDAAQGEQILNGKPIYGTASHRIWFARVDGLSGRWFVGTVQQLLEAQNGQNPTGMQRQEGSEMGFDANSETDGQLQAEAAETAEGSKDLPAERVEITGASCPPKEQTRPR